MGQKNSQHLDRDSLQFILPNRIERVGWKSLSIHFRGESASQYYICMCCQRHLHPFKHRLTSNLETYRIRCIPFSCSLWSSCGSVKLHLAQEQITSMICPQHAIPESLSLTLSPICVVSPQQWAQMCYLSTGSHHSVMPRRVSPWLIGSLGWCGISKEIPVSEGPQLFTSCFQETKPLTVTNQTTNSWVSLCKLRYWDLTTKLSLDPARPSAGVF